MTAESVADNVIMAIEHTTLPMSAVQFHPESILTVSALRATTQGMTYPRVPLPRRIPRVARLSRAPLGGAEDD